jgi:predicted esterase
VTTLGFTHVWRPGRSPRTLLLLHGTGGDENDLIPIGAMLDPDAAILSPRGKVLEGGAPRFFKRLAMGVFDLDDLRRRSHELADFVAAAAVEYGFDTAGVVAAGFSNGANIAAAMMLLRPESLANAILFRAMVPLDPDPRPDLSGRAVFLSAGRTDTMVPGENTERLARLLTDCGAAVELQWNPGGHGLTPTDLSAAKLWLNQ